MNIKQTSTPLVTGLISSSICFSFGFFSNVFKYNGLEFFYAYIAFLILLCYPMNIVAIYLQKAFPQLNTHNKLVTQITGSSKFKPISLLLTGTMIILVTLVIFNISTYILDFFDNIPAVDKLSDASLEFNNSIPIYTSLIIMFVIILLMFFLTSYNKLNLNSVLKTITHIALYLVTILMFIVVFSPQGFSGIKDFFIELNYQKVEQIRHMLGLALVYAILSNFISIAFYKNIISVVSDDYYKLRISSFKSVLYNILFSLIICTTLYAILGNYRTYLQPGEDLAIGTVFNIIKDGNPTYYLLTEIIFITLNLIVFIAALKYIFEIGTKTYIKILILLISFIMVVGIIEREVTYVDFSDMFGLHLLIIFLFLFDVFITGWLYDAQKLSYEILKNTNTKLSPFFNIILRIVIPFICIYIAIGYIFLPMSLLWQLIAAIACMIVYIVKGSIFSNIFNKRKF